MVKNYENLSAEEKLKYERQKNTICNIMINCNLNWYDLVNTKANLSNGGSGISEETMKRIRKTGLFGISESDKSHLYAQLEDLSNISNIQSVIENNITIKLPKKNRIIPLKTRQGIDNKLVEVMGDKLLGRVLNTDETFLRDFEDIALRCVTRKREEILQKQKDDKISSLLDAVQQLKKNNQDLNKRLDDMKTKKSVNFGSNFGS
jgi:hypothetical protein